MFSYIAYFFTKYFEGYKELIKSIDDWERSPILKGTAKFLATIKVIFDMLFSVGILFVLVFFLVDLIM